MSAKDVAQLPLATDAYIWGFSRMLYAKYLHDYLASGGRFNSLYIMDRMATPNEGGVNVDTLYGVGWLDLSSGPVALDLPDSHDRYYSIQLIDTDANNFAYIGRRTTGTKAQRILLAGPDWQGDAPRDRTLLRAPTQAVFAFLRTLIDDEADVACANAFHAGIRLGALASAPQARIAPFLLADISGYFPVAHSHLDRLGAGFFDQLGDWLLRHPPSTPQDREWLARFGALGIGPGLRPTENDPSMAEVFIEAVKQGHEKIFNTQLGIVATGWSITNLRVDEGRADPLTKAAINRLGIGTLSVEEAIYLLPASLSLRSGEVVPAWSAAKGPDGEPLTGDKRYCLRFPAGQLPPAHAFWSLTLYGADGRLADNSIKRHAIGDRTASLRYGNEGSLEIFIQHENPDAGGNNWLPSPAGSFHLIFRAYQPDEAFLDGRYQLPPLDIVTMRDHACR